MGVAERQAERERGERKGGRVRGRQRDRVRDGGVDGDTGTEGNRKEIGDRDSERHTGGDSHAVKREPD